MAELKETCLDHVAGENYATVYTGEIKWIRILYKLKEDYPQDVNIQHINEDGSIIAKIPIDWFKIKPKKKMQFTAAQLELAKARLERGRLERLDMYGNIGDLHE